MKKVIVKLLFYAFAGIGLIFQLKDIVKDYFAFKTSSKVELLRELNYGNPAIYFCIRFSDILNRSNYKKYGIHSKRHNDTQLLQEELAVLTVKDIFDLTPDPKDVIEECEYRHDSYRTRKHSKTDCQKLIHVNKFFSMKEICYQFMVQSKKNGFNCNKISLSLYDRRKIYSVTLSDEFRGSHLISMCSYFPYRGLGDHIWNVIDNQSRKFARSMFRLNDFEENTTVHNNFYVSNVHYLLNYLPPPYDTMCTLAAQNWKVSCERACNTKIYERYGRIPPDKVTLTPRNLKIITEKDLDNQTLMDEITMKKKKCFRSCIYEWCEDDFTVTEVTSAPSKVPKIYLASTCSFSPTHNLIFYPKYSLDEILIYTTSSFGVWFGFCFVSLNPTSLVLKFKKKIQTRQMLQPKNTEVKIIGQSRKFVLCIPRPEN